MTDNTHRFTGLAEEYDRFRQRYPAAEVLAHLRTWCGLTANWLVADIGAGTGMLSEVFLANGNRVLAVEPNPDMRERMRKTCGSFLGESRLEIIDATAEDTTLEDQSVDLVAAGRAFHWFDKDRALAEFRRILRPQGWIALVSIGRDHNPVDPALAEQSKTFERLLVECGTDYTYVRGGYRVHDDMQALFGAEVEIHQAHLAGTQQLDWPALRGQTMSLSVVPQADHANYEVFQRELRRFFESYAVFSPEAPAGILTQTTVLHITAARLAAL
jgi:ubiquinone/menaquinone biosynthesis C-methylase UbiE